MDIHDEKIREHVADRMARGYQWPDPWLSLNPNFASGGSVTDLIAEGLLQPECERIFRLKDDHPNGPALRLHQHQREAIEAARTGGSYVLTTGTGSGKSLAYIIPIVDRVLTAKKAGTYRPGIKAIVVYPMNALANSQLRELEKFLKIGYPQGPPVTFDRYTGQESSEDRARIIADPPDILLTNYVMLELVLSRPRDRAGRHPRTGQQRHDHLLRPRHRSNPPSRQDQPGGRTARRRRCHHMVSPTAAGWPCTAESVCPPVGVVVRPCRWSR